MKLENQLTDWVSNIRAVQFAIDQLEKYGGKAYEIKNNPKHKSLKAIFTEMPTRRY